MMMDFNSCLVVPRFMMDTLWRIVCALEKIYWALFLDLEDAYFHVAIYQKFRKYILYDFAVRSSISNFEQCRLVWLQRQVYLLN